MERIPVRVGPRVIDMVDEQAARRMAETGRNVTLTRRKRDGRIVQVVIRSHGGNGAPRDTGNLSAPKYSHDFETPTNPVNVWEFSYLPADAREIFRRVITECTAA